MNSTTNETFVQTRFWKFVMMLASIANSLAEWPQAYKIVTTQNAKDVSLLMFCMLLFIQVAFAIDGYLRRNQFLLWSCGIAASASLTIIVLGAYFTFR